MLISAVLVRVPTYTAWTHANMMTVSLPQTNSLLTTASYIVRGGVAFGLGGRAFGASFSSRIIFHEIDILGC